MTNNCNYIECMHAIIKSSRVDERSNEEICFKTNLRKTWMRTNNAPFTWHTYEKLIRLKLNRK